MTLPRFLLALRSLSPNVSFPWNIYFSSKHNTAYTENNTTKTQFQMCTMHSLRITQGYHYISKRLKAWKVQTCVIYRLKGVNNAPPINCPALEKTLQ